jgi:hypothetical protein
MGVVPALDEVEDGKAGFGVTTFFIAPGSLCEKGYTEIFIGKLRD